MARVSHSINLLRKKEKEFLDVFLDWAFEYGRFVIFLTEAIALCAFVYRFSLDRQIIDLNDKIKGKQRVVESYKPTEDKFRNLQDRLEREQLLTKQANTTSGILSYIVTNSPSDFTISKLTIGQNTIRLQADVTSPNSITEFVEILKSFTGISSISIDRIQNKPANAIITVDISAVTK